MKTDLQLKTPEEVIKEFNQELAGELKGRNPDDVYRKYTACLIENLWQVDNCTLVSTHDQDEVKEFIDYKYRENGSGYNETTRILTRKTSAIVSSPASK